VAEYGQATQYYLFDSLPHDRQQLILIHEFKKLRAGQDGFPCSSRLSHQAAVASLKRFETAEKFNRDTAEAWFEIIQHWKKRVGPLRPAWGQLLSLQNAFCEDYAARRIELRKSTYERVKPFSVKTLRRKLETLQEVGLGGLVPNWGNKNGGHYVLSNEHQSFIFGLIGQNPDIRPVRAWSYLCTAYGSDNVPTQQTVRNFILRWKKDNAQAHTFMVSPDLWRNLYQPAFGDMAESATHVNAVWELDSSPADVMCSDGKRWTVIGGIDVYSRRVMVVLHQSSSAEGVARLLRKMSLAWGLASKVRRDNGLDYASRRIDQFCHGLDIENQATPPFTPDAKPFIERFFRTLAYGLFEDLPGYIGHNVAQRQALRSRDSFAQRFMKRGGTVELPMTTEELQGWLDRWIEGVYHQGVHGELGMSPNAKAGQCKQPVRKIEDERILDILLAAGITRTVQKKGIFWRCALYQSLALAGCVGSRVILREDPEDVGRVYVFREKASGEPGEFLCVAVDRSLGGFTPQEYVQAKKSAAKQVREQVKAIRSLAADDPNPMQELIRMRETQGGKAVPFKRTETVDLEAVRQARKAVDWEERMGAGAEPRACALPDGADPDLQGYDVFYLPNDPTPQFSEEWERYEYIQKKQRQRPLTKDEREFIERFEGSSTYDLIYAEGGSGQ
jgi:transposase InsO family protein